MMVGQRLTVLAVRAGGDCSDIFSLSPIRSLFFYPLSGMDGWVTCGLNRVLVISGRWAGDGLLYAIPFKIAKISASSGARNRDR